MKVIDLDGNRINWKMEGVIGANAIMRSRSKLHIRCRDILYEMFPTMQIAEEVLVNVRPSSRQFFDFYINKIKLVVEVNGQQHYKFNSLFHSTPRDFLHQRKLDNEKREWCSINNISIVELPYNEQDELWIQRIKNR